MNQPANKVLKSKYQMQFQSRQSSKSNENRDPNIQTQKKNNSPTN